MSDQLMPTTFFGRIGNLFRRGMREIELTRRDIPSLLEHVVDEPETSSDSLEELAEASESRTTFIRPWVKRDPAIDHLQNGVAALSELMGSIRDTLERNSSRQDELLTYLSALPDALQTLPESNRVQGEALKAIQIGIEQQNSHQTKLTDVLERMHRDSAVDSRTLDAVRERVDSINEHEETIGLTLSSLGMSLESVSNASHASAEVLTNLRDNLSTRDGELERVIRRQNTRFTAMLAVAIVLSMAALTAVMVFGYLGYQTLSHMGK
jgi:chromosome segregation ATPase